MAPLTPAVFHILLALASSERHGYGIQKEVQRHTNGQLRMGPGTLYGTIQRLLDRGWIEEARKGLAQNNRRTASLVLSPNALWPIRAGRRS